MNCPSCGHENPERAKFCLECAAPFGLRCSSCGTELPATAKFCLECAQPVASGTSGPERDPRAYTPKHLADKILQSKSAVEGERKQVTVLFADIQGSMDLQEGIDAEEWHRIMDRFFGILTDGVHRFEGTVNQYTGDGIMALFGAPIAHEDHAQRGCYAALHLTEELRGYANELRLSKGLNFSVRMGLNSGEVVVGKIGDDLRMDYTAQGHTVGLAARMQQIAEPGKAYLTEETAALVGGFFDLSDLGALEVKGARAPLRVHELRCVSALHTRLDVARARGFSRFVGREREVAALEDALAQASEGNGQVVGVVGEAGVGKSRLCFEFVERCRVRGIQILDAHCPPHGRTIPFLPLLELLRGYFGITDQDDDQAAREKITGRLLLLDEAFRDTLPYLFELLGVADPERPAPSAQPEVKQRHLYAFVRRLVQTRRDGEPTILLGDDLHWVDPGSDAFLAQFVEAVTGTRTLLLVNFRPEYHADWMGKSYYRQLPLLPLGPEAVEELIVDQLGRDPSVNELVERIRGRTGGTPFFIEETVRSLAEAGSLVGERGAYRLAHPLEELEIPATVQAVLAARIDRLEEREKYVLQTAAVIGRTFAEPILRRVVELPESELQAGLHTLRSAEFIHEETLYPQTEYAFRHPLTHEVALNSQLSERRARLHAALARALEEDEPGKADERAALLAHHWEAAGKPLEAARWHRRAAEWSGLLNPGEALRHWRRVRELLVSVAETQEARGLALMACVWLLRSGWRESLADEEADSALVDGRRLAEEFGDPRALANVLSAYASFSIMKGNLDAARTHALEAERIAKESGDPKLRLALAPDWAFVLSETVSVTEALRVMDENLGLVEADPTLASGGARAASRAFLEMYRGGGLRCLRRIPEAQSSTDRAQALAQEVGASEVLVWVHHGNVLIAGVIGDPERALHHARLSMELAERIGSVYVQIVALSALCDAQQTAGRWEALIDAGERLVALSRDRQTGIVAEPIYLSFLARGYLGHGELERARATAEEGLVLARRLGATGSRVYLPITMAKVLLAQEGAAAAEKAIELLDEATAQSRKSGHLHIAPLIHETRAEVARLLDDDELRTAELREAHRIYTEMGATPHAERVARELAL